MAVPRRKTSVRAHVKQLDRHADVVAQITKSQCLGAGHEHNSIHPHTLIERMQQAQLQTEKAPGPIHRCPDSMKRPPLGGKEFSPR